jgi:hypothetical protein
MRSIYKQSYKNNFEVNEKGMGIADEALGKQIN